MIKTGTDRTQVQMFCFDAQIKDDHEVRVIDAFVEHIIAQAPETYVVVGKADTGAPAYGARDMLKLYLYGYMNGVTSSRRLERECNRNIEVRWLLNELAPDHKTIANFRKDHSTLVTQFTKDLVLWLHKQEHITGEVVATDGTKIKANTSRALESKDDVQKRLARFVTEHGQFLEQLNLNDSKDDALENAVDDASLQDQILVHQTEIARLREILEQMQRQGVDKLSMHDPEARIMKTRSDGKVPGYNVQMSADAKHGFIVSTEVTQDGNDNNQIQAQFANVTEALGHAPGVFVADTGYHNPDMIERIENTTHGTTSIFVGQPRNQSGRDTLGGTAVSFSWVAANKEYQCSQGKRLVLKVRNTRLKNTFADVYQGIECNGCPLGSLCTKSKKGRTLVRYHNQEYRDGLARRMKTPEAKQKQKTRKETVEHIFGTWKMWMGKNPLLLRGVKKVQTEIGLYSSAFNLRRIINLKVPMPGFAP